MKNSKPDENVEALYKRIADELHAHKRVLWLLSGGSNIPLSVSIMNKLPAEDLDYLAIALCDERYGTYDHQDSNLHQLLKAGFQARGALTIPILVASGASLEETKGQYERLIDFAFSRSKVVIAQLGIGEDGHIAGILPNSDATKSKDMTVAYKSEPFTRISLGFEGLKDVDTAFVFAFGKNKRAALVNLRDKKLSLNKQPAQILKKIPEVYLYNDQLGEKV